MAGQHIVSEQSAPDGVCIYCRQPCGTAHAKGCVTVKRFVRVRAVIEFDTTVPADWNADNINFFLNESSSCADNRLRDIEEMIKHNDDCLCNYAVFRCVGDRSREFGPDEDKPWPEPRAIDFEEFETP